MMELRIAKEELLKGAARAQAISEKRSSMQILSNLLLSAGDAGVEISATDLEIAFKGSYPAETIAPGQVCLPARTFYSIVRELASETVELIEEDNNRVRISGGKARYNLAGLPPEEFPALPQADDVELVDLAAEELGEMLDKTIYAMAAEEGRYNLAGVYLEKIEDAGLLRMVSTDGHRLSLIDRPLDRLESLDLSRGAIIPRKGVLEMRRLLDEAEMVKFGVKGNSAVLKVAEADLMMRLLEARYPDYRQVIPPDNNVISFRCKRPDMIEALRRMTILVTDKYRGIKLTLSGNQVELSQTNPDLGEAKETLEVDYQGDEMVLGFNAGYLLEALKAMHSETVDFKMTETNRPTKIVGPADENFVAVIMPMQV